MSDAGRAPVTVVIAAHNEAANIEACIESVSWVSEVIVVENDSTDDTIERATAAGAKVINPPFRTIGIARNTGIEAASYPWILALDADERCTPELAAELQQILKAGPIHEAYRIPRCNFFLGGQIRHGGWERDKPVRFFSRCLRYDTKMVHEGVRPTGSIGSTRSSLDHFTYGTLDQYFEKFLRYSRWWAEQNYAKGRRASVGSMLFRPPARFFSMYVLKGGWLDGGRGLVLASLAAASVMAKYARLWAKSVESR
jgi:glycosyltransferase involved in cell wall biosynthesis